MTNILLLIVIALLFSVIFTVRNATLRILGRPEKVVVTSAPGVTFTNREMVNENMIGQGDSQIIEPKTPQRVAFEEAEELRKMNIGAR